MRQLILIDHFVLFRLSFGIEIKNQLHIIKDLFGEFHFNNYENDVFNIWLQCDLNRGDLNLEKHVNLVQMIQIVASIIFVSVEKKGSLFIR